MKEWQTIAMLTVVCLGLATLWTIVLCLVHQSQFNLTILGSTASFAFGAIVLGKWLLGHRLMKFQPSTFDGFSEAIANGLLWLFGLIACAALWPIFSLPVCASAVVGMIAGALIWPPPASDETSQFEPVSANHRDAGTTDP